MKSLIQLSMYIRVTLLTIIWGLLIFSALFLTDDLVDMPKDKLVNLYHLPLEDSLIISAKHHLDLAYCEILLDQPIDTNQLITHGWILTKENLYTYPLSPKKLLTLNITENGTHLLLGRDEAESNKNHKPCK